MPFGAAGALLQFGLGGALFVCSATLLVTFWPFVLVSIFTFAKRRSLTRKWLFVVLAIIMCYAVQFVAAALGHQGLAESAAHSSIDAVQGRLALAFGVPIALSAILLFLLSRAFRRMNEE
jgi:hypothetical protein